MARPPLMLLPPSEGKAAGGTGGPWAPSTMVAPDLDERRAKAMVALARAMKGSKVARGKLLGVKGVALEAATEANREVAEAPTLPAIERYTGVLYDALAYPTTAGRRPAPHRRAGADPVRAVGRGRAAAIPSPTTSSRWGRRSVGWASCRPGGARW